MRIAVIGRTEWLYDSAVRMRAVGHEIGLVITAREAPEYKRTADDFRRLAAECGAPFVHAARAGSAVEEAITAAGDLQIAISMNYTGIIGQSVIDRFRLGILNAHGGDLPRYRGNACQAWAILNGEDRIGLCVHRMVGGQLDAGDIVARAYLPLPRDIRIGQVLDWMAGQTPELFVQAVNCLMRDPRYVLERQSTDPTAGMRCYPRRPEDGRIDWRQTALEILRLINASSEPYSGAFCSFDGRCIGVWRAELYEGEEKYLAVPGQIAAVGTDGTVVVICGSGKLRITEIGADGVRFAPATLIQTTRARLA